MRENVNLRSLILVKESFTFLEEIGLFTKKSPRERQRAKRIASPLGG
jgi:hypothetical protein